MKKIIQAFILLKQGALANDAGSYHVYEQANRLYSLKMCKHDAPDQMLSNLTLSGVNSFLLEYADRRVEENGRVLRNINERMFRF